MVQNHRVRGRAWQFGPFLNSSPIAATKMKFTSAPFLALNYWTLEIDIYYCSLFCLIFKSLYLTPLYKIIEGGNLPNYLFRGVPYGRRLLLRRRALMNRREIEMLSLDVLWCAQVRIEPN